MADVFDIKSKIVRAGDSSVFNNWHENAGITMDEFLDGLRWLCDDPMPGGKPSRELACVRRPGSGMTDEQIALWGPVQPRKTGVVGLHRLTRVYYSDGTFNGFYDENGERFGESLHRRFERYVGAASINVLNRI